MKVQVNSRPIKEAAAKAFKDTVLLMDRALVQAITDPVWSWPAGESPRDIVDKGTLRRSQEYRFTGRFTANFIWPVSYSAAVHNGATLWNGAVLPARPWTEKALKDFDAMETFGKLYRRYS